MKWCKIKLYHLFLLPILFWIFILLVKLNQEKDSVDRGLHFDAFSQRPPPFVINDSISNIHRANSTVTSQICEPNDNIQVLFFNRIAKCASTSFVELLQKLSHMGNYDVIFNRQGAYDWKSQEALFVAEQVKEVIAGGKKTAYAQHFYYTDFSPYLKNYGYVTLVREPVERLISSFNYYHYSKKEYIRKMLPNERRTETLLECVQMEHEGCKHNLLTKYFCGHSRNCSTGSKQALQIAKYNLKNKFLAVGLVENLTLSMQLFQRLVPFFFPPMPEETFARLLPYTNQNKKIAEADSQIIHAIKTRNQADIELYQYAKDLFFSRLRDCNI